MRPCRDLAMRDAFSLHLALYRRQKLLIAKALEGRSAAFRRYEDRYRRRTRLWKEVLSRSDAIDRALSADIVHVGDYHTLPAAQRSFLEVITRAKGQGRRVVLALECLEGRLQPQLDAWSSGALSTDRFFEQLAKRAPGGLWEWGGFRQLLLEAHRRKLQVVAIDLKATGPEALKRRDTYAAKKIAEAARADDRPQVLVLMGQYHVAPCHLPAAVSQLLGSEWTQRTLYQNCEGLWWSLARARKVASAEAAELPDGSLCLLDASPVVCQQSFLDYLEAPEGMAPALDVAAPERVHELARRIAKEVSVDVRKALGELEVVSVADADLLERIRERGRFTAREARELRDHVLSRESAYIPRARMAYLASLSLHHAAEEAAHFVRHCAVGDDMERERPRDVAFFARIWEEALAFLGSRLVDPARACPSLETFKSEFHEGTGHRRKVAAYVLALTAAQQEAPGEMDALLPLRGARLFLDVSHALGYLLGDGLARAYVDGGLSKLELRSLFRDRLEDPKALYVQWTRRVLN